MPDRVASRAEARSICAHFGDEFDEVNLLKSQALDALIRARDIRNEACGDGFWSLSTLGDVVGIATAVGGGAACFSNPVGWVTCGAGIVAGGGTIIISEASRDPESGPLCDEANALVTQTEATMDIVNDAWFDRMTLELDCFRHHWKWWGPQE
jgi:hypothetical protein